MVVRHRNWTLKMVWIISRLKKTTTNYQPIYTVQCCVQTSVALYVLHRLLLKFAQEYDERKGTMIHFNEGIQDYLNYVL